MCLSPDLSEHILKQGICVPSRVALQRSRLELDLASMIYGKRYVLNTACKFFLHLRADSSPQGGRDYFIAEYDLVKFYDCPSHALSLKSAETKTPVLDMIGDGRMSVVTRLLPLSIIGSRAASAVHKAHQLLRSLSLDCEDVLTTLGRTVTLLFDMGAESGLWTLNALHEGDMADGGDSDADGALGLARKFPRALPLADADHALHHAAQLSQAQFEPGFFLSSPSLYAFALDVR